MRASIYDLKLERIAKFDVPQSDWDQIITTLSKANEEPERSDLRWLIKGDLIITKQDLSELKIELWQQSESDDAVFTLPYSPTSRINYRGGSQSELFEVLRAAEAAADPEFESFTILRD